MQVTNRDKHLISAQVLLKQCLDHCARCKKEFDENVATIADDGFLTNEQVEKVLVYLTELHEREDHE